MRTPYSKERILSDVHWKTEGFRQRITTRCWKLLLLNNDDKITFEGRVRDLVATKLGYGVVEISKKPRPQTAIGD